MDSMDTMGSNKDKREKIDRDDVGTPDSRTQPKLGFWVVGDYRGNELVKWLREKRVILWEMQVMLLASVL